MNLCNRPITVGAAFGNGLSPVRSRLQSVTEFFLTTTLCGR